MVKDMKTPDRKKLLALLLTISVTSVVAYAIITSTINVGVQESISISPQSFDVSLYPKQSVWVTFTVSNANPTNDTDVDFSYTVTGPTPSELTVDFVPSSMVNVPASGSADVKVRIRASKSIPPGAYTISITWNR